MDSGNHLAIDIGIPKRRLYGRIKVRELNEVRKRNKVRKKEVVESKKTLLLRGQFINFDKNH